MSAFLSDKLKQFEKIQSAWKKELPCYVAGVLVGFRLMDPNSNRRFFCGVEVKPGGNETEFPLPLDIMMVCKKRDLTLVIAVNDRWYEVEGKKIKWGNNFLIRSIPFAKINLREVEAVEMMKKEMEPVE